MRVILSEILISAGVVFIVFGIIGVFRFKNIYTRLLVSSKVDIVGFITIMAGVVVRRGFDLFSLKIGLIIMIMIITSPLIAHSIARSAFFSGFMQPREEEKDSYENDSAKIN